MPEQIIIIDEKIDTFSDLISSAAKDNRYEFIQATTLQEGLLAVENVDFAIVLISYKLGSISYIEKLNQKNKKLYIVLLTTKQLQFLDISSKTNLVQYNLFYPINIGDIIDLQEKIGPYLNELNGKPYNDDSIQESTVKTNDILLNDSKEEDKYANLIDDSQKISIIPKISEDSDNTKKSVNEAEPLFRSVDVLADHENVAPANYDDEYRSKIGQFIVDPDSTNIIDNLSNIQSTIKEYKEKDIPTLSNKNQTENLDINEIPLFINTNNKIESSDNNLIIEHNNSEQKSIVSNNDGLYTYPTTTDNINTIIKEELYSSEAIINNKDETVKPNNSIQLNKDADGINNWEMSSLFTQKNITTNENSQLNEKKYIDDKTPIIDEDFNWNISSLFKSEEEQKLESTFSKILPTIDKQEEANIIEHNFGQEDIYTNKSNIQEEDNNTQTEEVIITPTKDKQTEANIIENNFGQEDIYTNKSNIQEEDNNTQTEEVIITPTRDKQTEANIIEHNFGQEDIYTNKSNIQEEDNNTQTEEVKIDEHIRKDKNYTSLSYDNQTADGSTLSENSINYNKYDSKEEKALNNSEITEASNIEELSVNNADIHDNAIEQNLNKYETSSFDILQAVKTITKKDFHKDTSIPQSMESYYNLYDDESSESIEKTNDKNSVSYTSNTPNHELLETEQLNFDPYYDEYTTVTEAEKLFNINDNDFKDDIKEAPHNQKIIRDEDDEDAFLNNLFGMLDDNETFVHADINNNTSELDQISENIMTDLTDYENNILDYFVDSDEVEQNIDDIKSSECNDDEIFLKDLEDIAFQREEEEKANLSGLFEDIGTVSKNKDTDAYYLPKENSSSHNLLANEDDDLESNLKNKIYTKNNLPYIDNTNDIKDDITIPYTVSQQNKTNRNTEDSGFKRIANFISEDAKNKNIFPKRAGTLSIDLSSVEIEDILTKQVDKAEIKTIIKDVVRETIIPTVNELVPIITEKIVKEELELIKSGN